MGLWLALRALPVEHSINEKYFDILKGLETIVDVIKESAKSIILQVNIVMSTYVSKIMNIISDITNEKKDAKIKHIGNFLWQKCLNTYLFVLVLNRNQYKKFSLKGKRKYL